MLSPTVHQLAEDYKGRLKVVQVNVDRAGDLAGAFGVSSIPTLICFRDGRALGRSVGLTGKAELEQRLRSWAAV